MSTVKHSERIPGIGFVTTYAAKRCDDCGVEERMTAQDADGNVLPHAWTRTYLPSTPRPGLALQRDHCPGCSEGGAA